MESRGGEDEGGDCGLENPRKIFGSSATRSKTVSLGRGRRPLELRVNWGAGIGGDLWTTGLHLVSHMVENVCWYTRAFGGKRIMELGSGSGLVALAAGHLLAPSVLHITDLGLHLDICGENARNNAVGLDRSTGGRSEVSVFEFDWNNPGEAIARGDVLPASYDLVLGTDVVYFPELYEPFISALKVCLGRKGSLALLGVTKSDTSPAFFDLLTEAGLAYYIMHDIGMNFGIFSVFYK